MASSVHELCQNRGLSVEDLIQQSGLEPGRVQAIYLGRWTPSPAERKKIAEELKASEARYRSIFENTGAGTIIIEKDTTISMIKGASSCKRPARTN